MPVGRCVMRTAESGDVDVLSAGAARAVGVDPQILFVDLHFDVVRQVGPDEHRRKRGVAARGLVERRDSDQPVHPGLCEEQAVRVVAGHRDGRALDARLFTGLKIDDLAREAAAFRPPEIHAQQHFRPVLRLGAAGARVDGKDRVGVVVRPAEHLLDLGRLYLHGQLVEPARQIVEDRFALAGPFQQDLQVVAAPPQ